MNIMENKEYKKCCECGSKFNLLRLENGKYGCIRCLDKLAKMQLEIKENIISYLESEYDIVSPQNQIKILQSIVDLIAYENNLLDKQSMNTIKELNNKMNELRRDYRNFIQRKKNDK